MVSSRPRPEGRSFEPVLLDTRAPRGVRTRVDHDPPRVLGHGRGGDPRIQHLLQRPEVGKLVRHDGRDVSLQASDQLPRALVVAPGRDLTELAGQSREGVVLIERLEKRTTPFLLHQPQRAARRDLRIGQRRGDPGRAHALQEPVVRKNMAEGQQPVVIAVADEVERDGTFTAAVTLDQHDGAGRGGRWPVVSGRRARRPPRRPPTDQARHAAADRR